MRRPPLLLAVLLFALSGASSLIFETAWTRLYLDLFGHGIHTTSSVLAAFMAGLGFGALLEVRLPRRSPFLSYAVLEFSIGLWVLGSPILVRSADHMAVGGMLSPFSLWLLSFGLLLVPTTLMGATLPLLARALIEKDVQIGRVFGLLYGINSLGAVLGVLGAGYWGLFHIGVRGTLMLGCALNVAAATGALLLDRLGKRGAPGAERISRGGSSSLQPLLPAIAFMMGLSAMAYEILWIRIFVFVLESSILALSLVLAVLLLALGLGSLLFPLLLKRRSFHLGGLVWTQSLLAAFAIGGLAIVAHLDTVVSLLFVPGSAGLSGFFGRFLLTACVVFLPGLMMGASLPALTGGIAGAENIDLHLGRIYAANSLGNIIGALAGGFLLIPLLGISSSMLLLAGLNLLTAAVVSLLLSGWRREVKVCSLLLLLLCGALLASMGPAVGLHRLFADRKAHAHLLSVTEGLRGTVTLFEVPPLPILASNRDRGALFSVGAGYRMISVDGVDVAGSSPDLRTTQKMQAHVPLQLHGGAKDVLQIGYGSGETAHEVALYHPSSFDLVEINPQVINEAQEFFGAWQTRDFHPIFADAKNYLRRTRKKYDAILNDSTYPGLQGSSQLYSADHFRAGREHLRTGGVFSTWLPVDLPPETFAMVLATFRSVFPECSYWLPLNCWNKHGVLVGTTGRMDELLDRLRGRPFPASVKKSLREIGLSDRQVFLSSRVLDAQGIAKIARGSAVNSDDHPYLEYPLHGVTVSGEKFWSDTLGLILQHRVLDSPCTACVEKVLEAQRTLMAKMPERALRMYSRAGAACPKHPGPRKLAEDINLFRAQEMALRAASAEQGGNREEAIVALKEALALCPFSAAVKIELGRLYFLSKKNSEAIPLLRAGIRESERGGRAWLFLGDAELLRGQYRQAELDYRSYLEIEGGAPTSELLSALAQAQAGQKHYKEALATLAKAEASQAEKIELKRLRRMWSEKLGTEVKIDGS